MKIIRVLLLVGFVLAFSGCGVPNGAVTLPAAEIPQEGISQAPGALVEVTEEPSTGLKPVADSIKLLQAQPTLTVAERQALVEKAQVLQAKSSASALDGVATDIGPITADVIPAVWADGSLGCPDQGMMSSPGLTPGYVIILHIGETIQEYHVGADQNIVYCENPLPPVTGLEGQIEQSRLDLAGRLGVSVNEVKLISAAPISWPDGSLGCSQPGEKAVQVLTPGFLIILEHAGLRYEYHSGGNQVPLYCESPSVSPSGLNALIALAKQDLSVRLSLPETEISLVSSVEMLWPDSTLGCPQTEGATTLIQIPGYQIILEAAGAQYEYHTDKEQTMVHCDSNSDSGSSGSSGSSSAELNALIEKARQDLSTRMSIALTEIKLVEATEVVWPDAGLGCGKADMMYAQMLTPGYRIVLSNGGAQYEYHSNKKQNIIFCEQAIPLPGSPD
ncbi:MAG: hypothetical protein WCK35_18930 [Chloroflexota bacterium]